jgi:hypothetical protein
MKEAVWPGYLLPAEMSFCLAFNNAAVFIGDDGKRSVRAVA